MKLGERTFRLSDLFFAAIFALVIPAASFSQIEKSKADVSPQTVQSPPASSTQQSPPQRGSSPTSLQVSSDELYALQKLRIQKELQDEILKWAQTRFWLLAIASLLIGFFGVRALVREFVSGELKDAMRASVEAQAAAESARESIREVRAEAGKYKDLVDSASTAAADVNEKL